MASRQQIYLATQLGMKPLYIFRVFDTLNLVKTFRQLAAIAMLFGGLTFSSHATFSSIYIFGDSISTTTTNNSASSFPNTYYGKRYSNGRNWVEVLAQRQGLGANSITNSNWDYSSNNLSFYGQYSPVLLANVNKFSPPTNATNCLFVVWVCNADFVGDMATFPASSKNWNNQSLWTEAINQHLINHSNAIVNLYAKGCRALVAPDAVDLTEIPQYNNNPTNYKAFVRQQINGFNSSYAAMLKQIVASSPGLVIYNPDIFGLLDNVLTNAASYGLTNALYDYGYGTGSQSIDVVEAAFPPVNLLANANANGPGTNYIFLDPISPTAQFSEVIADFVQQLISPVQISHLAQVNGSNRLDVVNMPVGLNGFLDNSTNLAPGSWTLATNFTSFSSQQSIFVPTPPLAIGFGPVGSGGGSGGPPTPGSGTDTNSVSNTNTAPYFISAAQFYRLRFPYAWNWP